MARLILAVEDDQSIARLYIQLFEDDWVEIAESAADALNVLQRTTPDVVILDLGLQQSRGEEVVEAIDLGSGTPPVVIVSASERAPEVAKALGLPLIRKPLDINKVVDTVDRLTDHR